LSAGGRHVKSLSLSLARASKPLPSSLFLSIFYHVRDPHGPEKVVKASELVDPLPDRVRNAVASRIDFTGPNVHSTIDRFQDCRLVVGEHLQNFRSHDRKADNVDRTLERCF